MSYETFRFELHAGECSPHGCGGELDGRMPMSKQDIVDDIEQVLTRTVPIGLREKILDAVWNVLEDEMEDGE